MPVELLPPHRAVHGDLEWLEIRRQGVTASEIAVILGLSRWDSPWSLWHRKRGLIGDDPDSDNASWGRRLEGVIADAFQELDLGRWLYPAGLYRHSQREWQMATPDRLVTSGPGDDVRSDVIGLLEVKHPYSFDGWGEDGSDDVPADYHAQALWQLDVMDLDQAWLAAYSRHEMRVYTIRREGESLADLAMMRARALEFLRSDTPPPLDSHPATLRAVKALHPDIEDREQEVPDWIWRDYEAAVAGFKAGKERKLTAEILLRQSLGDARYAINDIGRRIATRSVHERRSIDGKRLRADLPDIAEQYTTTSTVDRLLPARKEDNHEQDQ